MKSVNIFDFNNLAVRVYFTNIVGARSGMPDIPIWKSIIFDNIVSSINKNGGANEVVLALDSMNSWRKQYWSRYKESRKGKRDTSGVNWDIFHTELAKFSSEIKYHLPVKVIQIKSAEADDIIGVICLQYPENSYTIISTDEDYLQLCNPKVRVYNPLTKEMLTAASDTDTFVNTKCLTGQPKDDIFNIYTPLDYPKGKRKPPFGPEMAKKVLAEGLDEWLERKNLKERFRVNKILIDFKMIPKVIKERVLDEYDKYEYPEPSMLYEFVKKNSFHSYIDGFTNLEYTMSKLY
jgi:5'-3' exonuclease